MRVKAERFPPYRTEPAGPVIGQLSHVRTAAGDATLRDPNGNQGGTRTFWTRRQDDHTRSGRHGRIYKS
jgi:hypothetical protein